MRTDLINALTAAAMLLAPWEQNRDVDQSISAADSCPVKATSTIASWRCGRSQLPANSIDRVGEIPRYSQS